MAESPLGSSSPHVKSAAAAWERYASTVRMAGTPAQRIWAFAQAMIAEERLARAELLANPRQAA